MCAAKKTDRHTGEWNNFVVTKQQSGKIIWTQTPKDCNDGTYPHVQRSTFDKTLEYECGLEGFRCTELTAAFNGSEAEQMCHTPSHCQLVVVFGENFHVIHTVHEGTKRTPDWYSFKIPIAIGIPQTLTHTCTHRTSWQRKTKNILHHCVHRWIGKLPEYTCQSHGYEINGQIWPVIVVMRQIFCQWFGNYWFLLAQAAAPHISMPKTETQWVNWYLLKSNAMATARNVCRRRKYVSGRFVAIRAKRDRTIRSRFTWAHIGCSCYCIERRQKKEWELLTMAAATGRTHGDKMNRIDSSMDVDVNNRLRFSREISTCSVSRLFRISIRHERFHNVCVCAYLFQPQLGEVAWQIAKSKAKCLHT